MRLKRHRMTGFGLAALLLFIPLLLIMLLGLFAALTQGSRWTGAYQAQTAAGYVAEAGAAHALQKLRADPEWVAGFGDSPMVGGRGAYTIEFNQSGGGFAADDSVNNFDGDHADSHLGPDTVPAGSALLVVTAQVGAYRGRSLFLVGTGDSIIRVEHALLTSGRIALQGQTHFRAVESISEKGDLTAKVQSNNQGDDDDMITWSSGSQGGTIAIEGEVRSAGTSERAVNLAGYRPTGGVSRNAAQVKIPPAGIVANVYSKRGAPALASGTTSVPVGESFYDATSSPLEIQGDLVLEGDLYVEGDLKVNGSITGRGSVYVTGNSELYGDASINGKTRVALHSHGHVALKGFEGDRYLDGLANSDPDFRQWLDDARWATDAIQTKMNRGTWERDADNLDGLLTVLAPGDDPDDRASDIADRTGASLVRMREKIETLSDGRTRDFMVEKIDSMTRLFSPNSNVLGQSENETFRRFTEDGVTDGIVEAANDHRPDLKLAAFNVVSQLNYDRLGNSYFQGLIYTNGAFYAENQVTVLGAVAVSDDDSQDPLQTPNGEVNPGDLVLRGGSSVTYVKDYFFGPNSDQPGPRRILLYLGDG